MASIYTSKTHTKMYHMHASLLCAPDPIEVPTGGYPAEDAMETSNHYCTKFVSCFTIKKMELLSRMYFSDYELFGKHQKETKETFILGGQAS